MTKRILLVDDEVEITEINKRYLTQAGYEVNVAHDGQEALELFQKYSIDLIITDIMMPNMDGYDLIGEVNILLQTSLSFLSRLKHLSQIRFILSVWGQMISSPNLLARGNWCCESIISYVAFTVVWEWKKHCSWVIW